MNQRVLLLEDAQPEYLGIKIDNLIGNPISEGETSVIVGIVALSVILCNDVDHKGYDHFSYRAFVVVQTERP